MARNEKGSKHSVMTSPGGTLMNFRSSTKTRRFDKEMGAIEKDRLCQVLKKDVRGNAKQFWDALKSASLQHFESTDAVFMAFSSPSDCMMSLEQFQELSEYLGFALTYHSAKNLFEQKLRDREMNAMTLEDFQDACIVAPLDRIRARLRGHRQNMLACAFHIDNFIRHLSLFTGEDHRRRAVTRFQQKLTTRFCVTLWSSLQQWAERKTLAGEPMISKETFLKLVDSIQSFQAFEMDFFGNIYERVDRGQKGEVVMFDLTVTILLMATSNSRCDKAKLIFTVFDTDGDGCLSSEQLLKMYCSLIIHAAIARGDQPSYDADLLLGDELSLAKARRIYDYTLQHPSEALDDDLCTFEEWWFIIGTNMNMLEELMPGSYCMTWVLRPRGGHRAPEPKVEKKASKRVRGTELNMLRTSTLLAGDEVAVGPSRSIEDSGSKRKEPKGVLRSGNRKVVEDAAERFRIHAAIRFRHAVRGEWDAIAALQSGPPGSADVVHLPSLDCEEKLQRSTLWAEEVGSFRSRQRRGHWHDNHRDTLTDWSRNLPLTRSEVARDKPPQPSLRQTQSLPELRSRSANEPLEPSFFPSAPLNFEEVHSMMRAKIVDTTSQDKIAVERLKMDTQRFGQSAIERFRSAATVRAGHEEHVTVTPVTPGSGASGGALPWCELCQSRHSSLLDSCER